MRLIDADELKRTYREIFVKNLIDRDRGIDLSEYAKEPCDSFDKLVDDIPTVCDIDAIRDEIEQNIPLNDGIEGYNTGYAQGIQKALQIIDKYRG